MLACARIGAVHSIVFGGFSPDALAGRIEGCQSKVLVTADEGLRGGRKVPLKVNADDALKKVAGIVKTMIVVKRTGGGIDWVDGRDVWYADEVAKASADCAPVEMNAEDPLFLLYTSGSTGAPKGVVHSTGGYLVFASMTHQYVFDYHDGDIYWCTADVGWVTGHSYIVYGPLANGATTLMFEGIPNYPSTSRFWQVVDKHKVNIFYTAPTAIRSLMGAGEEPVKQTSRASLRLLGSVGEPINPEAWDWYHRVVGDGRCPIVDTWWQTETGGILISPLPGATALKPGSATLPFFGVMPEVVDASGAVLTGACEGNLVIADSWPGQMPRSTATTSASCRPTSRPIRASISPAMAAGATPTATTGSPAASTTSSTYPVIAWGQPKSKARSSHIRRFPKPLLSVLRTTSRGRASTPTSP
jgi:acetyl-CoA synthetase